MNFTRDELSAFLDGDLDPMRAAELQRALALEPALAGELEALRELRAAAAALPATAPVRDLWPAVRPQLAPRPGRRRWIELLGALAAGLLLGFLVFAPASPPESERFVLLLHSPPSMPRPANDDELRARIRRYADWAASMRAAGKLELGEKLWDHEGFDVDAAGARPTGSGDVSGLFILRARDYDEAKELAGRCPHAASGGSIELRRIFKT